MNNEEAAVMQKWFVSCAAVFALLSLTGCATERYITPTISGQHRTGLTLERPIIGAVLDGRAVREPSDAASVLQRDLTRMYGEAIEWDDYFAAVPDGRVGIRIRLVTLGARFGSRLISSTAFANSSGVAEGQTVGRWGAVVASASSNQSTFAGSFSGEGWWNGAAWVDIEVIDRRVEPTISVTIPIIAEHRESNMWGYASGKKAARASWEQASEQLIRALDMVVTSVRDDQ